MTISFSLAPNPKWYFVDFNGLPLGGGFMATFRSLNPSQQKIVFQDPAGINAWPYIAIPNQPFTGISIDANGTQGPFYFQFDTAFPDETYLLMIFDSQGVLQWTIDNFTPTGGSGGSIVTTAVDLENLIINNVMYRHVDDIPVISSPFLFIAPGANSGLATTPSNLGPDIVFVKNNISAVDSITFPPFLLGSNALSPDETPVDALSYTCGNTPIGEAFKFFQFPITSKVQNLSGQVCTYTIWAKGTIGKTITLNLVQFFGDGSGGSQPGGGGPVKTIPLANFVLTAAYNKFSVTAPIPSVATGVEGACGNSGLFLQIAMPLNTPVNVQFTKPSMYLGNLSVQRDYHSYDMIDSVISSPRTGDIIPSMNYSGSNYVIGGYVPLNDGVIGNATSPAVTTTGIPSTRRNLDTFPLFNMIWNGTTNANCPIFDNLGNPAVRGASAIIDYQNSFAISLPKAKGRTFASVGTPGLIVQVPNGSNTGIAWALGQTTGNELHTQSIAEMPSHIHPINVLTNVTSIIPGFGSPLETAAPSNFFNAQNTQATGGGGAFFVEQPTVFVNYLIKL